MAQDCPRHSRSFGLLMAAGTALMWAVLPLLMRAVLVHCSFTFIAWVRLAFAAPLLFAVLQLGGYQPRRIFAAPPRNALGAGLMLAVNYYCFARGVDAAGAALGSVLIQSGALFFILLGVFVFRERLSRRQASGVVLAIAGFYLFYLNRAALSASGESYVLGSIYLLAGGLAWGVYAGLQKSLGQEANMQLINMLVFATAAVVLTPLVDWPASTAVAPGTAAVLALLGVITLGGYGAFVEAIKYAPAAQVSMVVALTPLLTLAALEVLSLTGLALIAPEPVSAGGYIGALLVVCGVVLVVRERSEPAAEFSQGGASNVQFLEKQHYAAQEPHPSRRLAL